MRQKSVHPESPSERIVKNIRRATRKRHSSEEKDLSPRLTPNRGRYDRSAWRRLGSSEGDRRWGDSLRSASKS